MIRIGIGSWILFLREADRLGALVNDFLMFAKPQPGQVKIVDLNSAIREILNIFVADHRRRKRIEVVEDLADGVFIEIDPEHLRQVLWNLLLNADEAIEGEGRITVVMQPLNKSHVYIRITDTGCGITEETIKTIFDPFFTAKPKGNGLGLSIVQRIITSYNGLIEVQSTPGQGTTFEIQLPKQVPVPSR